MKEEMAKIIVEKPRVGGSSTSKLVRTRFKAMDDEDIPHCEGMRRAHKGWSARKELNENLTPLYRFLNSCVGRKWNDVYSEICSHVNRNSAVQLHILQHLLNDGFVELHVVMRDGEPYDSAGRHKLTHWRRSSWRSMYVDPASGILKFVPEDKTRYRSRRYEETYPEAFSAGRLAEYRLVKGIWYWVSFRDIPSSPRDWRWPEPDMFDILEKELISRSRMHSRYNGREPVAKRQLSKRDIKKHNLWQRYQERLSKAA